MQLKIAHPEVKKFTSWNAKKFKFEDNYFDLVISINTVHNLELEDCITQLKKFHVFLKLIHF
jgi:ubiquinone/menaquinone biosynthesis C-methylase UbiE